MEIQSDAKNIVQWIHKVSAGRGPVCHLIDKIKWWTANLKIGGSLSVSFSGNKIGSLTALPCLEHIVTRIRFSRFALLCVRMCISTTWRMLLVRAEWWSHYSMWLPKGPPPFPI